MSNTNTKSVVYYPLVSVCTPTFNRRPFIETMFACFRNQNYPKKRIEWIIVDDGTDKIADLVEKSGIQQIKYISVAAKMALGEKRNFMHSQCKGSIIVYMDDDDYYPPERISHAVERLLANPAAMCAGASEIYLYFKHIATMYQAGPYGPNHATAGTFAFRKELLETCAYEPHAALAEEKAFLKNYTIPFVQLDPLKTILVFSHDHNTFDKKRLLNTPHPDYFRPSTKTVDDFIRTTNEKKIKKFFMTDIDGLLKGYAFGDPSMKPDVMIQIRQLEEERQRMIQQASQQQANQQANPNPNPGAIMMERPGQPPLALSQSDIVNLIKQQQGQIAHLTQRIEELQSINNQLQLQLIQRMTTNTNANNSKISPLMTEMPVK